MAKRKRSDSTAAAAEAMQKTATIIDPPEYVDVSDDARPFWDAIISTRAVWSPHDYVVAAQLARINADIEKYNAILAKSGRIVKKENGGFQVSPVHKVLKDLVEEQQRLCRTLQIHARATQGESRDQIKRNALYSNARAVMATKDNLIARPTLQ